MLSSVTSGRGTIQRSIYFYRADTGAESGQPKPLDLTNELLTLDKLPFGDEAKGGRYVVSSGDDLCAFVDSDPKRTPVRVRLARIRRSGMPQSELAGILTPVQLPDGAGLYEATHMVFFKNHIVGVEFNFYGPRPRRFEPYLRRLLGDVTTPFFLEPLIRRDAESKLRDQEGLRLFQLKIRPSSIAVVEAADRSLGAALRAQQTAGAPDMLGLYLQAEPKNRRAQLAPRLLEATRVLARRQRIREEAELFLVKGVGQDGRVNKIDVLSDGLISRRDVPVMDGTARVVSSDKMYEQIEAAHRDLFDELIAASALGGDVTPYLPHDPDQ
ncbi:MAG: hypothetical protein JWP40_2388 [Blastococcus sp.]|nr:hypothetical protein [Blastococcus sp.]